MKTINKIPQAIIFAAVVCLLALAPFILSDIDWSQSWFLPAGMLTIVLILILALINIKNVILGLIIFLPGIYYFNYIKVNLSSYLPFLQNQEILINPAAIVYVLVLFLTLVTIVENWGKLGKLPLKYLLLLTIIYTTISLVWSSYKGASLVEIIYALVPFAFYLLAYVQFNQKEDFIKLIWAVITSSIIPILASGGQIITGSYYYETDSSLGRLTGSLDHPNTLGLFLFVIIGLIATYYLSKANQKIMRNKMLLGYGLLTAVIFILSYSRTSWLCLALFFLLLAYLERKIFLIIIAASPILLLIAYFIENIRFRLMEIFNSSIFNSLTARENIWHVAWQKITEQPIIGYGVGTSEIVIEQAKDWLGGMSLPHNDYLLQTLELGAIGLVLFILYTAGAIYYAAKTFVALPASQVAVNLFGKTHNINLKIVSFGILCLTLSLLVSTILESTSQKIIIQIIIWSLLGSLFSLKHTIKV